MARGDITLALNGLTHVDNFMTSLTPRTTIEEQQPEIAYTANLNSVIRAIPSIEGKQVLSYSALTTDEAKFLSIDRLFSEQNRLIYANAYSGITVTDEIARYQEYATVPTRAKTSEPAQSQGNGYISYWAKFSMAMRFSWQREGGGYIYNVTLSELAKLT
jgi:hypothetical protein